MRSSLAPRPAPILLAALAALAGPALTAAQGGRPRPGRGKPEKIEPLVKLPEDFVRVAPVPGGARLPRLAAGGGTVAVLGLLGATGDGEMGELVLAVSRDDGATFGEPAKLAPGGVRTWDGLHSGSIDVGPDGRVHVAWIAGEAPGVLYYASASAAGVPGETVELGTPPGLTGTTAVALDAGGRIHLFYVASDAPGGPEDPGGSDASPDDGTVQPGLRVWMRRSADGVAFDAPMAVDKDGHDVSGASALAAHVDEGTRTMYVLYRCAALARPTPDAPLTRDVRLLASEDGGASFTTARVDPWKQQRDPSTSASLVQDPVTTLAIWEARGAALWTPIRRNEKTPQVPNEVRDAELVRFRPAGASGSGEVLLAWLERPRGEPDAPARIAWRVWQRDKRFPIGEGVVEGSEGASGPAVFARPNGGFLVLH